MTNPTPPYQTCVTLFLDSLGNKPKTRANYATGCRIFGEFVEQNWPTTLTKGVLVDYNRWLYKRKPAGTWQKDSRTMSEQSIRTYLSCARAFLGFLNTEELLPESMSFDRAKDKLKKEIGDKPLEYPYREADPRLPKIVMYYDNVALPAPDTSRNRELRLIILRNRAIMHTMYSTAGRIGEIASLSRNDVGDGLSGSATVTGKRKKTREIYFTPEARKAIQEYLKERTDSEKALFIGHRKTGKLGVSAIWRVVKKAAKVYEMDVHPHDFRHFRASQLRNEGAPMDIIKQILGHSNVGTTERIYAHLGSRETKEAFYTYSLSPEEALEKARKEGKA